MTPAEATMDIVFDVVCRHYRTTKEVLLSKDRTKNVFKARSTTYWLARHSGLSWPEVGKAMHRDHSTAMGAVKRLQLPAWEHSKLIREVDHRLGALEDSDVVAVIFNKKTMAVLQELLDSGLWGGTLEDVVERVTCQYLHEQLKRKE